MRRWLIAAATLTVVVLAVLFFVQTRRDITREDAERIAASRLTEYAKTEGIDSSTFTLTLVRHGADPAYPWMFEYQSTGTPRHRVNIAITRKGGVQLGRMIE